VNDGDALEATLAGVLDEYPELATVACVPLGVSDYTTEAAMRAHTTVEAEAVIDTVEQWQELALAAVGRRLVYAADEYYLIAGRPFPAGERYDGFPQHENGIGMARAFATDFAERAPEARGTRAGFFAAVDGAPAAGYRAARAPGAVTLRPRPGAPVGVLTGEYGAQVLSPLLAGRPGVRVIPVANEFFGGNIAVTGLLVGADLRRVLAGEPEGHRYLLPDVCLSGDLFLDGTSPSDLPRPVEIVPTDGASLRRALEAL
jgi:NifB/MoaA-like Fe-S oxidoreductase